MKKILFVCTGNICRSPTAHAIARHKAKFYNCEKDFIFDSAGIDSYHVGEFPDRRSVDIGKENGINFDGIFAKQIQADDFRKFDLIFAMDRSHVRQLMARSDEKFRHKIKLFLEFCEVDNEFNDEVIDPYYGSEDRFRKVFSIIDEALDNLILGKLSE